jgi:hypothetical protein
MRSVQATLCERKSASSTWTLITTYHDVIANEDTCVVPPGRDFTGRLRAPQTRLMSSRRKRIQPVAHLHKSVYTAQVTLLQKLRDFAWGKGTIDGVTAMLCGAHDELKFAARRNESTRDDDPSDRCAWSMHM